jgi:hypothetical protein
MAIRAAKEKADGAANFDRHDARYKPYYNPLIS